MTTLFYQAQTSGNMWDTWLYWHAGTHYLYNLAGPGGHWHGIALATSTDGVHWREHGLVLEKGADVTWMGTGSVWPLASVDGAPRFMLNFSEWRGDRQTIFFAESADLVHWQRCPPDTEFRPDGRWYRTTGGNDGRWDCIYTLPRPGGGFYGYWTANPLSGSGFGFGESADGRVWQALPPPALAWGATPPLPVIESGAVAEVGGRYYTMLGTYAEYGPYASGMFGFVADAPGGPFRPQPANYALLTSPKGRWHSYFARFYPCRGELLVNHHVIAPGGAVSFAPLKRAAVDAGGSLRLHWWPGNEAATHAWPAAPLTPPAGTAPQVLDYAPAAGLYLEATLSFGADAPVVANTLAVACADGQATVFTLHPDGRVSLATRTADGSSAALECVDRQLALSGPQRCRVLLMAHFVELYLADHLIQVHSLPAAPAGQLTLSGPWSHGVVRRGG